MSKTITICASAAFYKEVVQLAETLEKQGYTVLIPDTARKMQQANDFDVSHYKTWFGDAKDYHKKTALMRGHFDKVAVGDAILVVNSEKHGVKGYIGGNVLMEMALAFHLHKPIYVLNPLPVDSPLEEEIIGLEPIVINNDLTKLP